MPWEEQAIAGGTWEEQDAFKESFRYSELTAVTYEDMSSTRYDSGVWVDQPIAGGTWV